MEAKVDQSGDDVTAITYAYTFLFCFTEMNSEGPGFHLRHLSDPEMVHNFVLRNSDAATQWISGRMVETTESTAAVNIFGAEVATCGECVCADAGIPLVPLEQISQTKVKTQHLNFTWVNDTSRPNDPNGSNSLSRNVTNVATHLTDDVSPDHWKLRSSKKFRPDCVFVGWSCSQRMTRILRPALVFIAAESGSGAFALAAPIPPQSRPAPFFFFTSKKKPSNSDLYVTNAKVSSQ